MMSCSGRRQSTGLYRMVISVLIVGILFTNHAAYGSASEHQQHQQEAIIDPSGQMKFSSSNEAVDEAGAIKAGGVEAVTEPEVDHPAGDGMESCADVSLIEKEREDLQAKLAAAEERLLAVEAGAIKAGGVEAGTDAEVDHPAGDDMESCVDVSLIEKEREDLQAKLAAAEERLLAVDEAGAIKDGDGVESCVDVSLIEKEREDLQAKLAAAEERLLTLQKEAESREADHFSALGSCGTDKDTLLKEVEAVRREAGELTEALKEAQALAEKAAAADATQKERDEAAKLAAEQQAQLKSELDDLRKKLSGAEAKAREAWEEVEKNADGNEEVRRKLERTASELEIAQKPRKVSVAAILTDLQYLFDDLVHQSADARDDIMSKGTVQWEKAIEAIQPYYKIAREVVDPQLEKAMSVTAPQREKAAEVVAEYWTKIDDAVMRPAGEKWTEVAPIASKVARQAWAKWQAFEVDLHRRLINAGLSKDQADKVTKYAYFGVMATVAVILLLYLTKPILSYVVIPLVRTVLRWALWLIFLPIRILLVWPVMLIMWLLTRSYRLVFGKRAGKGAGKGAKPAAAKASKAAKGRAANGKVAAGTSGKKRR